jgi:hypothetical protein
MTLFHRLRLAVRRLPSPPYPQQCWVQTAALPAAAAAVQQARVLDGRSIAAAWQEELAHDVRDIVARAGRPPGLGVVLVGSRPDSVLYVVRKREACERVRHPALPPPVACNGSPGSRLQEVDKCHPALLCPTNRWACLRKCGSCLRV